MNNKALDACRKLIIWSNMTPDAQIEYEGEMYNEFEYLVEVAVNAAHEAIKEADKKPKQKKDKGFNIMEVI